MTDEDPEERAEFERVFLPHVPARIRALYAATDDEARAKMRPSLRRALAHHAELKAITEGLGALCDPDTKGKGEA